MNTGLRPMRSASIAHSGSAASATALAAIETHSIVVRSRPWSLTAKLSAQTAKIVLTVDASAASATRRTSRLWSRQQHGQRDGRRRSARPASRNAGVSSSRRRISTLTTIDDRAQPRTGRASPS